MPSCRLYDALALIQIEATELYAERDHLRAALESARQKIAQQDHKIRKITGQLEAVRSELALLKAKIKQSASDSARDFTV